MNWDEDSKSKTKAPKQQQLFSNLNAEEQLIVDKLTHDGAMHIDQLSKELSIPAFELFSALLELEMKGVIKNLPGSIFEVG